MLESSVLLIFRGALQWGWLDPFRKSVSAGNLLNAANAAPEWQAETPDRKRESVVACPLKGLVGKCSSPEAGTSQDGVSTRQTSQYLSQAKTGGRP
jgi:hypothetical protein